MTETPHLRSRRKLLAATGSIAAIGVAGCLGDDEPADGDDEPADGDDDHDDHDDDHDDHDHDLSVEAFEILDRGHDEEVIAYVHHDHWDHGPLEVPHGDYVSVGASVEDEDGEEIELGDEIELTVEPSDDSVSIDGHGDHVHVYGEEEGFTEVVFQLVEDGDVVYETPDLEVAVDDHDHGEHGHGHGDVEELSIFDRSEDPHEEVAEFHDDHWDGELPHVHVDDNISLGAEFVDDHGDEIHIGGDEEYELAVTLANDAEEGIVEIDPDEHWHSDHVHIYGESEGETEVVFKLWHDDHADWESEPIPVDVEDH